MAGRTSRRQTQRLASARRMEITGVVQGVGFRPFVYNLALRHGLRGWVRNTSSGVEIEVEGPAPEVESFMRELPQEAPPRSHIERITTNEIAPNGYKSFVIRESLVQPGAYQLISPDIATCDACRREMWDEQDRRYGYPFINCTNCGPRFTIIEDVPYDRPKTTMRAFQMCPDCQAEYDHPADRRFHAQPNACPVCGPHLWLVPSPNAQAWVPTARDEHGTVASAFVTGGSAHAATPTTRGEHGTVASTLVAAGTAYPTTPTARGEHGTVASALVAAGTTYPTTPTLSGSGRTARVYATAHLQSTHPELHDLDVIRRVAEMLKQGEVLALKGLGGFHLACDATDVSTVNRLRERKQRPHKPFAVMLADMEEVSRHCEPAHAEVELLTSPACPIVLLRWRDDSTIARNVAPENLYLGVMLPYTPLHHLLLREVGRPLVMTSGNLSEEPIAQDNEEALQRLGGLADAFLLHDRAIFARYDDSVWFVPTPDKPQPLRRARGYAPSPIGLPFVAKRILACGAELKNTFCLTRDEHAFVSQHIGDMENVETLTHFQTTVQLYERLFRCRPEALAGDLHPDYLATRYAQERARNEGLPLFYVQHHHAHVASCLADNCWRPDAGPVIGVAMDGTGYGSDGRIWGGEFLIADYHSFRRFGHLEEMPLPGGDAATRRPYRIALACLRHFLGTVPDLPFARAVPTDETELLLRMVDEHVNTPWTSSAGRLFDAVSALLGVCTAASYEAQAAIELEMIAAGRQTGSSRVFPFSIEEQDGSHIVRLGALFEALVRALQAGQPAPQISAIFHHSMAGMIGHMCQLARRETGLRNVALSGGCFQSRRLLLEVVEALESAGFRALFHRQVPCNDGGLSLGQAMVAHFRSGERSTCV